MMILRLIRAASGAGCLVRVPRAARESRTPNPESSREVMSADCAALRFDHALREVLNLDPEMRRPLRPYADGHAPALRRELDGAARCASSGCLCSVMSRAIFEAPMIARRRRGSAGMRS